MIKNRSRWGRIPRTQAMLLWAVSTWARIWGSWTSIIMFRDRFSQQRSQSPNKLPSNIAKTNSLTKSMRVIRALFLRTLRTAWTLKDRAVMLWTTTVMINNLTPMTCYRWRKQKFYSPRRGSNSKKSILNQTNRIILRPFRSKVKQSVDIIIRMTRELALMFVIRWI